MQGRKYSSGGGSKYPLSFREEVALDYVRGDLSAAQVAVKYSLPSKHTVKNWVRALQKSGDIGPSTPIELPMTEQEKRESDAKDRRIKELERLLEDERLRSLAYSTMIDVAEEELGVPIRKKSGPKQSRG
jgi:transposase-like protein